MALHSPATCCLAHPGFADESDHFRIQFNFLSVSSKNAKTLPLLQQPLRSQQFWFLSKSMQGVMKFLDKSDGLFLGSALPSAHFVQVCVQRVRSGKVFSS